MPEITRADASRIDELEPLWLALRDHHGSVTEHWGPLRPPDDSWGRRRAMYEEILNEGGVVFLVEDEGTIAGMAVCDQEEWHSPTWEWPSNFLAIVDFVVLPSHRGHGVGAALLEAVEAEARERGLDAVDMNAAAPNEDARAFYEHHGYRLDLVTYRKPLD